MPSKPRKPKENEGTTKVRDMHRRTGDNPTRRIIEAGSLTQEQLSELGSRVRYVGSGHHKRNPLDYGFERTSPRPTKSLCDTNRIIKLAEAQALLAAGIQKGMISHPLKDGLPKFVWCVSETGEAFEAKTHPNTPGEYHGYPLEAEDNMRDRVLGAWGLR